MSRLNRSVRSLAYQAVALGAWVALLPAAQGCSVHATWEAGTTPNEGRVNNEPANAQADADARARERRRRREEELARIDREAKERVKQAEQDAADQERAADEEAERQRQQAAADAEQKKQEEAAAAAAEAEKKPALKRHNASAGTFVSADGSSPPSAAQSAFERRRAEIEQTTADKKLTIRRKLEQNKSDILVAAERKRNEVQATMKDESEAKP